MVNAVDVGVVILVILNTIGAAALLWAAVRLARRGLLGRGGVTLATAQSALALTWTLLVVFDAVGPWWVMTLPGFLSMALGAGYALHALRKAAGWHGGERLESER